MEISHATALTSAQSEQLHVLAERARRADGSDPFSDDLWRRAVSGETDVAVALTADSGELRGVAFAAPQGVRRAAELLVDPEYRAQGHGAALLATLLDSVDGELWVWAHGDHPAARILAARTGLDRARELFQLRRPAGAPVPRTQPPPGVTVRSFVPGQDEQAWVDVNAAAFSWHPEQGAQTVDDLLTAEGEPWFDPDGFFLATGPDGELLGFHWTKIHQLDDEDQGPAAIGEVYVLGVAPYAQGDRLWTHLGVPKPSSAHGLGTHLTAVGLDYLAAQPGVEQIMLYVEGDNPAALKVYERLGFTRHTIDVAYRR
ncbi:mycothiol synthase [Phytoactinopolyspora endophytica]|uniref:mycothiol synthase n=1 Tax=Phytoactinopolyspora endophytica TaxID=1642495 RepID=UPI00101D096E|nr:mycothiol synthase [Phytoactinopolyspora endophytica]